MHNFTLGNDYIVKPQYSIQLIDEVLEIIIRPGYTNWFITDASNSYWAVCIRPRDEYKAAFITPHGLYLYLGRGQELKGAPYTYSQFTSLVFGPLPHTKITEQIPSIIGTHANCGFYPFIDDYIGGFKDFDVQFKFLHKVYFPRVTFGPVYLAGQKTRAFYRSLEVVRFIGDAKELRPSVRHRDRVWNWLTPKNRRELEAFI